MKLRSRFAHGNVHTLDLMFLQFLWFFVKNKVICLLALHNGLFTIKIKKQLMFVG
jgi:hypothetical protein